MRFERTQNSPKTNAHAAAPMPPAAKRERERHAIGLHQDGAGISADAEIGGMAERDEAGIAEQKIEADREQREDRDVGCQKRIEARAEKRHADRHKEEQRGEGNAADGMHRPHRLTGRPRRPDGRTTSTNAIRTNTANSEKPGSTRMPNAST